MAAPIRIEGATCKGRSPGEGPQGQIQLDAQGDISLAYLRIMSLMYVMDLTINRCAAEYTYTYELWYN